jgi:hypothetical protein
MSDNSISGVSPPQPTPPYGPDKPRLGSGEEGQQPKPFTLGPEGSPVIQEPKSDRPSPMEVASDAAKQQRGEIAPEELNDNILKLQGRLNDIQGKMQDPTVTQRFVEDHYTAMQRVTQLLNPDMQTIAKNANGEFIPPGKKSGQSVVNYVSQWLDGAQGTLGSALNYLQNTNKPDVTSYLKLQYAVQRASQRGELFASIVGSSVSGIKTIMSTQLG